MFRSFSILRTVLIASAVAMVLASLGCESKLKLKTVTVGTTAKVDPEAVIEQEGAKDLLLTAELTGSVWTDLTANLRLTAQAALAKNAKIEILKISTDDNAVELVATTKTNSQGEYSQILNEIHATDVLSVVAYQNSKSIGQALLPISSHLSLVSSERHLILRADINRAVSVASAILIKKRVALNKLTPKQLSELFKTVESITKSLGVAAEGMAPSELADLILADPALVKKIEAVLNQPLDEDRNGDQKEAWDFNSGRQPVSEIFASGPEILGVPSPETEDAPLILTPAIVGDSLDLSGSGVRKPVSSVKVSISPMNGQEDGKASCYIAEKDLFDPFCPQPIQVTLEANGDWQVGLDYADLVDGTTYTLTLHAVTPGGASIAEKTITFIWRNNVPSSAFVINVGDPAYTKAGSVSLILADDTDVAYFRKANSSDCSGAPWIAYQASGSILHTLSVGDGLKTVCFETKASYGLTSATSTDTIVLDGAEPDTTITMSGVLGPGSTAGSTTEIAGLGLDLASGIKNVDVSIQKDGGNCLNATKTGFTAPCPTWVAATGTTTWKLAVADLVLSNGSVYQVSSRGTDKASNVESTFGSSSFTWSAGVLNATFTLGAGNPTATNTNSVNLVLADDSNITEYRKADGADCSGATWTPYGGSGTIAHTLSAGDGTKTVCLQVRDTMLNQSSVATDTIQLDVTAPSSAVVTTGTVGPNTTAGAATALAGTASDLTSGVGSVTVSVQQGAGNCLNAGMTAFDAACPVWHSATGTTAWALAVADSAFSDGQSYTISSIAADAAGNAQAAAATSSMTWDSGAPNASFTVGAGDPAYATTTSVSLVLADDTGVAEYRATAGSDCSAATWTTYSGSISYALAAGDGAKTVCVEVRDSAQNVSTTATDGITLDATVPDSSVTTSGALGANSTAGANTTIAGAASDATSGVASVDVSIQAGSGNCLNAGMTAFDAACPVWHAASGTTSWSFDVADALLVDATTYNISSRATDGAGNIESAPGTGSFSWDSAAPSPSFNIAAGATYTQTTAVTIDLDDDTGVAEYRVADGSDCSASSWTSYATPINFTLAAGDGTKTVCVEVRDSFGNASATATDTIVLDSTEANSAVSTNGTIGPSTTAGVNTTLSGTASDATAGVASVAVSIEVDGGSCLNAAVTAFDAACPVWHAATGTTAWSLSLADTLFSDGTLYHVSSKALDQAGNDETTFGSNDIAWSDSAPSSSFTIEAGDPAYTTAAAVSLVLSSGTNVAEYRAADGTDCSAASWTSYGGGGTISYTLPAGDGAKTVCLEVRDAVLNTSGTATDTVTLDTALPSSAVTSSGTYGPTTTAGATTALSGTASDTTSGVATVSISIQEGAGSCLNAAVTAFDAACPVWHAATGTTAWSLVVNDALLSDGQTYTISSEATDAAGLVQTALGSNTITWDSAAPSASFTIEAGDPAYVTATSVSLVLADATDVAEFRKADGSDCSAATWTTYSGSISHTLPAGDGTKTVCLEVRDALGNASATVTDTVTLDTTLPSSSISTSGTLGPSSTAGATTDIAGSAADATSGLAMVEVSIQEGSGNCLNAGKTAFDTACPVWHTATGTTTWAVAAPDSVLTSGTTYAISSRATDNAGLVQTTLGSGSFVWDDTAPAATFTISAAAAYTTSTSVTLDISDDTGVAEYRAADGSDCSAAVWTSYAAPINFTLAAGDGTKTVCVEVRDSLGNASATATDTIVLDGTLPDSAVTTTGTLGPNSTAGANTTLNGAASDATSGVASVSVSIQEGSGSCLNAGMTAFDAACPEWHAATGTTTWSFDIADSLLTDGTTYNISSQATDNATNVESTLGTNSFTWSAGSLNAAFTIDASDPAYVSTTAVSLVLADDTNIADYRAADGSDCSAASWTSYGGGGSISYTLPSGDGAKTVCLEVRDAVLNTAGPATDTVTLDTTEPDSAVASAGTVGPATTAGVNTDLTGTASDAGSGIATVDVSIESVAAGLCLNATKTAFDAACPVWHTATGTTAWTLTLNDALFADGTFNISSRATDAASVVETTLGTSSITWDGTTPGAAFTINAGDPAYVNTTAVSLVLADDTGVAEYRAANGTDCSSATWTTYSGSISHTLASGDGLATVCLEVRDTTLNASSTVTDTVTLDETLPDSSITTNGTLGGNSTAGANTTISGTASDATSGIAAVDISIQEGSGNCLNAGKTAFDAACPVWHVATGTTSWSFDVADALLTNTTTYNISSRATDAAVNVETTLGTGSFTWDAAAPSAAFTIGAADPAYVKTTAVTLELADDTGVAEYRATSGSDCSAASWTSYSGTINFTLASGDGAKTVCLEVRDSFANTSSTVTDSVTLDETLPASAVTTTGTLGPNSTAGANTTVSGTASDATSAVASVAVSIQEGSGNCLNATMTAFDAACPEWHAATGTTSWTLTIADALLTNATTYNVSSRASDNAANDQTALGTSSFSWSTGSLSAAFTIESGDPAYVSTTAVSLVLADDTNIAEYRLTNGSDCSAASWTSYGGGGTIAHTLASGDGGKTVCLEVRDSVLNTAGPATDTVTLDTAEPDSSVTTSGTIGPATTAGATTSFAGTASDGGSGVASVSVSIQQGAGNCLNAGKTAFDAACPVWHAATGTTSWTLTLNDSLFADGTYTVSSRATDGVSTLETTFGSATVTWDQSAPDATFSINTAAAYTTSTAVTLDLSDDTSVAEYRAANGTDCSAATWTTYSGSINHTLASGDGLATVCLEVRDTTLNVAASTDTITLDETEPASTVATSGTLGGNSTAGANTTISGSASDATSGVAQVEVSIQEGSGNCLNAGKTAFDVACPVWHTTSGTTSWSLDVADALLADGTTYSIASRAADNAGLTQTTLGSGSFAWDAAAPAATFTINAAAAYTTSTSVTLDISDDTGVAEYRAAIGSDCSASSWTSYATPVNFSLTVGDGTKTVCLEVRDSFGNTSTTATDTITLDETLPDSTISTTGILGPNSTAGANTTVSGTASDATSGIDSVSVSIQAGAGSCLNAGMTAFDAACPEWHAATGTTSWSIDIADALLTDGTTYNVSSKATDNATNAESTLGTNSFTWSTGSLNAAFTINAGDPAYVNTTAVSLVLADDTNIAEYRLANGSDCSAASWTSYGGGGTIAHTLASGDGAKTVCLEVRDAVLNTAGPATDTVTLDTTEPDSAVAATGTVGPATTAGVNTDLTGTASDAGSGINKVDVSIESVAAGLCLNATKTAFDAACPVWHTATGTTAWTLTLNDGLFADGAYNISSRATDAASVVETTLGTSSVTWDGTAPSATFTINAGDPAYVNTTAVSLVLADDTGVAEYRKANGADCSAAIWTTYSGSISHTLASGDGLVTVCLEVRDTTLNVAASTDTITLDETKPVSSISTSGTLGGSSTAGANTTISGSASDATSGVASVEISIQNDFGSCLNATMTAFDASCPEWHAATGTTSWSFDIADSLFIDGKTYGLKSRATDAATNVQTTLATGSFTWDATPPDPAFAIAAGDSYTGSTSVTLDITDDTGVAEYRAASGADCSAATWTAYAPPINFTLASGDGPKTVCIEVRDSFANASATATDTITLDQTEPNSAVTTFGTLGPNSTPGANTTVAGAAMDAAGSVASVDVSIQAGSGNCLNAAVTAFDATCPAWHTATGTTSWSIDVPDALLTNSTTYNVTGRAHDEANNVETTLGTGSFVWDGGAPNANFTIESGDPAYVATTTISLVLADATDVAEYRKANGADCSAATWTSYGGSISHSLTAGDGAKTVCLEVRDTLGNASTTATDTTTLDTSLPASTIATSGTIGPNTTAGANTTLTGSASDTGSGVASVAVSLASVASGNCLNAGMTAFDSLCPVWHTATGTTSWSLAIADSLLTDGEDYEISSLATDGAGNDQAAADVATFTWDAAAPNSSFVINSGNPAYATTTSVSLVLSDATAVDEYRVANTSDCSAATWQAYGGGNIAHSLAASDGSQTVCLEVRDATGNVSSTSTDSITLDRALPTSSVSLTGAIDPNTTAGASTTITGSASDATSGVATVEVSIVRDETSLCLNAGKTAFDAACPVWHTATGTTSWSASLQDSVFFAGDYTISSRATDAAGLVQSSLGTSSVTWSAPPPNPAFSIESGDPVYVTSTSVTLVLTDATGVAQYRKADGTDCSAATWTSYSGSIAHSLPAGDGNKTVCLEVRDAANNASTTATDNVTLDSALPTSAIATTGTIGPDTTAGANSDFTGSASDTTSGVTLVELSVQQSGGSCLNALKTAFDATCPEWHAVTGTTAWSLSLNDALFADGDYLLSSRATDAAGLVQSSYGTSTVTWDAAAVGPTANVVIVGPSGAYGNVIAGSAGSFKTWTVLNAGATDVTSFSVALTTGGDFTIDTADLSTCDDSTTLTAGSSCSVTVKYAPAATGADSDTLTVSFAEGSDQTISLSGTGTSLPSTTIEVVGAFDLSLSPGGKVDPTTGNTVYRRIQVRNIANATETGITLTLNSCPAQVWRETTSINKDCTIDKSGTLAANDSCFYTIGYNTAGATFSCTASITATHHSGSINVPISMTSSDLSNFQMTPIAYSFGTVVVGSESATLDITLSKISSGPGMTVNVAEKPSQVVATQPAAAHFAEYSAGTNNCIDNITTIPNASSCVRRVSFKPTAPGFFTIKLLMQVNSVSHYVVLSGNAVNKSVSISDANPYDFGYAYAGAKKYHAFTVTNSGTSNIGNVTTSVQDGATTGTFAHEGSNCAGALNIGGTCQVLVSYESSTASADTDGSAYLRVEELSAPVMTKDRVLKGKSFTSESYLSITSTELTTYSCDSFACPAVDYGEVELGSPRTIVFTVTNHGLADATDFAWSPATQSAMTGADAAYYTEDIGSTNCSTTLAAGASCTVGITFTPTSEGTNYDTAYWGVSASNGNSASVNLQGAGASPLTSVVVDDFTSTTLNANWTVDNSSVTVGTPYLSLTASAGKLRLGFAPGGGGWGEAIIPVRNDYHFGDVPGARTGSILSAEIYNAPSVFDANQGEFYLRATFTATTVMIGWSAQGGIKSWPSSTYATVTWANGIILKMQFTGTGQVSTYYKRPTGSFTLVATETLTGSSPFTSYQIGFQVYVPAASTRTADFDNMTLANP